MISEMQFYKAARAALAAKKSNSLNGKGEWTEEDQENFLFFEKEIKYQKYKNECSLFSDPQLD